MGEGLRLVLLGLFKKLALADNLAALVALGFDRLGRGEIALGQFDALLLIMAFGLQIYLDFSGYTDMGRGVALMLGFRVPENFRRPLLARNIGDFWRRWHISLSHWLRDYVYRPLGPGRSSRYRSVLITMVVAGVWHGAGWTFLLWGLFHGLLFILYWMARPLLRRFADWCPPPLRPLYGFAGWLVTIFLIFCSLALFRSATLSQAVALLAALSGLVPSYVRLFGVFQEAIIIGVFVAVLGSEVLLEWMERPSAAKIRDSAVIRGIGELRPVLYALLLILVVLVAPQSERAFVYFQF
jgi:alginate O-acetyltransferase complex protein AlgI